MSEKKEVNTRLRLPIQLHRKLKELAEEDNRSLHNYIIHSLENHIKTVEFQKFYGITPLSNENKKTSE